MVEASVYSTSVTEQLHLRKAKTDALWLLMRASQEAFRAGLRYGPRPARARSILHMSNHCMAGIPIGNIVRLLRVEDEEIQHTAELAEIEKRGVVENFCHN